MSFNAVLAALDLLDSGRVTGADVAAALRGVGVERVAVVTLRGEHGSTDVVRAVVPGTDGHLRGGPAPTLGLIGRLGGIGARPERIGLVSDADGAVAAVACAMKLGRMQAREDPLSGDVIIATQICPHAPTKPHDPVPFVGSPVDGPALNREEVDSAMGAILSIVTTSGNRVINHRGFAISPTVKAGWILPVSTDLLTIQEYVTGRPAVTFPLSVQDITPVENRLYHLNTIMEPSQATEAPVVGVALTAEVPVPGSATGASHAGDIELTVRFAIEVAKAFGQRRCRFYDDREWAMLLERYGSLTHLQTIGRV